MNDSKKQIIAMLLAGGQGSRLKELTEKNAKPAVPFGGKYRIIDFALSNCTNSGIDTVGVLTQYEPYVLNHHKGIGSPWDLDRQYGGVKILPPFTTVSGGRWYKGTANAIYENISFIDTYSPKYVLILSGDHIYNMDYSKMLKYHIEKEAALTVAVKEIPIEEASRFGVLIVDENSKIIEFQEKPQKPKSNLASMGIYIFNWADLRARLISDENDQNSENDFGKNIIPKILNESPNVFSYTFDGYWKDVGTVNSLWESNMDLLDENCPFNLNDSGWKNYTLSSISPAQYIGEYGEVTNSLISDGCVINGTVNHSVLSPKVFVSKDSKIDHSVIMSGVTIEENVILKNVIVMENMKIKAGTSLIGKQNDILLIHENGRD